MQCRCRRLASPSQSRAVDFLHRMPARDEATLQPASDVGDGGAGRRLFNHGLANIRVGNVSLLTDMKHRLARAAKLFRGFSDLSRLRVLDALRDGPLSAGEVVTRTGLSQPNASMHLRCLAQCGLVTWERRGKYVHYEIADKQVVKLLDQAEDLLLQVAPLIDACPRYRRPRAVDPTRRRASR